jgi:hypothetical protein
VTQFAPSLSVSWALCGFIHADSTPWASEWPATQDRRRAHCETGTAARASKPKAKQTEDGQPQHEQYAGSKIVIEPAVVPRHGQHTDQHQAHPDKSVPPDQGLPDCHGIPLAMFGHAHQGLRRSVSRHPTAAAYRFPHWRRLSKDSAHSEGIVSIGVSGALRRR